MPIFISILCVGSSLDVARIAIYRRFGTKIGYGYLDLFFGYLGEILGNRVFFGLRSALEAYIAVSTFPFGLDMNRCFTSKLISFIFLRMSKHIPPA